MPQSNQKLTRGQMVYAPISSSERTSKSPFSSNKKILIGTKTQNQQQQQQPKSMQKNTQLTTPQSYYIASRQKNLQSPIHNNNPSLITNQYSYHHFQQIIQSLQKQNQQLKSRQEIYISKLMKLQQGLQKQHQQFMNLQQLYEELFNGYKQKQEEISQLQTRYRETQRSRIQFNTTNTKIANNSLSQIDKMNSIKNTIHEENLKNQIALLIFQNKRLNETNQKLVSQLNYVKSKQKLVQSRKNLQQKVFDELNDYQKIIDTQKQEKIKLQYENRFFKMRIEDLQKNIVDLQKVISLKQTQIIKMRQQKMHIRRQSSQKVLNRSPPRSNNIDSSRGKTSHQQNKKFTRLIQNLQKQNQKLRQENIALKQKYRAISSHIKSNSRVTQNPLIQIHNRMPLHRKLDYQHTNQMKNQQNLENSLRSYQNQNYNSQNTNQQYFSFSRQRDQKQSSQEDLPTFPMDLQIQGIIRKHKENSQKQQSSNNMIIDSKIK